MAMNCLWLFDVLRPDRPASPDEWRVQAVLQQPSREACLSPGTTHSYCPVPRVIASESGPLPFRGVVIPKRLLRPIVK